MADDVAITAGSGTSIATDDIAGRHFQRVKLTNSTADSTTATGVDADPLVVRPRVGATSTLSNVSASASSVTLLAANTSRRSVVVVNDGAATLYVKEGASASTTSYTYKLQPDDTLILDGEYSGIIDGIWSSATGAARITERT